MSEKYYTFIDPKAVCEKHGELEVSDRIIISFDGEDGNHFCTRCVVEFMIENIGCAKVVK